MSATRFGFRFDPKFRPASLLFGVTPRTAWVEVDDVHLRAHFGPWRLRTRLDNIGAVEVTGPYLYVKSAGPARLALTDSGLTFATNRDRGVLITFKERVRGRGPYAMLRHEELTVTVEDIDGLVATLARS